MDHLPIFINVRQNPCLVIGGGDIAFRKINLLIKAQAKVDCLSPLFCEGITNLSQNGDVNLIQKRFESDDIKDYAIIIASTDDSSVNALISKSAKKARIPVNVVDSPELSSFIMPSIVDRSPVIIAVSSAGKAPVLSSEIELGEVYLVGAGPGDPDLLTFKALRLIQQADVVLYDRLVSKGVMELVRRDSELIYVGKKGGSQESTRQIDINDQLVELAKSGKRVCRLKGGDPFIFGRGGEEIESLSEHGIPFQVVPGITAASGCSSYAGIPLTHRDYSQSCRFVTAHLKNGTTNLPWDEFVIDQQTIVFYMALSGANYICQKLMEHGMDKDMPIAIIEKGTMPEQKVYISSLTKLPDLLATEDIHAPTLMIVGEVVKLNEKLNWYGT